MNNDFCHVVITPKYSNIPVSELLSFKPIWSNCTDWMISGCTQSTPWEFPGRLTSSIANTYYTKDSRWRLQWQHRKQGNSMPYLPFRNPVGSRSQLRLFHWLTSLWWSFLFSSLRFFFYLYSLCFTKQLQPPRVRYPLSAFTLCLLYSGPPSLFGVLGCLTVQYWILDMDLK